MQKIASGSNWYRILLFSHKDSRECHTAAVFQTLTSSLSLLLCLVNESTLIPSIKELISEEWGFHSNLLMDPLPVMSRLVSRHFIWKLSVLLLTGHRTGEPLFGNLVSQQTSKYQKIESNDRDDVCGSAPKSTWRLIRMKNH